MYNRIKKHILIFALVMLWFFFLFLQHLACFDLFDTNAWYLYMLAAVFALAHYFCVFFVTKQLSQKQWKLGGAVYSFLSLLKLYFIFSQKDYASGLTIFCIVLDAFGIVFALLVPKGQGDGSPASSQADEIDHN